VITVISYKLEFLEQALFCKSQLFINEILPKNHSMAFIRIFSSYVSSKQIINSQWTIGQDVAIDFQWSLIMLTQLSGQQDPGPSFLGVEKVTAFSILS